MTKRGEAGNGHRPSWFTAGGVVPLEVAGFGTLQVKRDLSHAERKRMVDPGVRNRGDGTYDVDTAVLDVERVCAWVVGWDAVDESGEVVPFDRAAVEALNEPAYRAIERALAAHEAAQAGKVRSGGAGGTT